MDDFLSVVESFKEEIANLRCREEHLAASLRHVAETCSECGQFALRAADNPPSAFPPSVPPMATFDAVPEAVALATARASETRAWNVVRTIRNARVRECSAIAEMTKALENALPLLVRLGDFIGNHEGRTEAVLAARDALERMKTATLSVGK